MIDTHTHIYEPDFDEDREEVIARAKEAGLLRLILPNIDLGSIERMKNLAFRHPHFCKMGMGLHPSSVGTDYKTDLKQIEKELSSQDYCAIGEIGIDLYWDKTYIKEQLSAFETQLHWAAERNLPVIIHVRDAMNEVISVIKKCAGLSIKGVFHSFGGTLEEIHRIAESGDFMFGINGIVTFKNANLKSVLPAIGIHRIVLETDAPYLSPVPRRGKRNEPAYLPLIAQAIADALHLSSETVQRETTTNADRLFKLNPGD